MAASLSLSFTRGAQDIASNSTEVTIVVTLHWTYGTYNNANRPGGLIIDGTEYSFSSNFNWNGSVTNGSAELFRKTVSVKHNDDGNKTLNYSAYFEYHVGKFAETAGTQVLPFIARTSQPSCITWPEHTQKVGDFGTEISIHTNRKASSLTHTLRYQFGSQSGTIATDVGTGTKWVIPLSLMDLIPNNTSGSGTIYCDTYSGSTKIGTASCGFTATVPASIKPSCSLTLDDVTKVDEVYGSPVQGLSRIKVTVSATTAYSSPIASYSIEANGVSYSGSEITTGILQKSGDSPVTVTVRDKRGRTGSASYTMSVQAYTAPTVSKMSIKRCDEDGTENDNGAYIQVTFSAVISSMSNKNTAAYALRYKKSTDDEFTTVNFSALANKYAVTNHAYRFAADPDYSYDIEVVATDKHGSTTRSTSGSTAFTLMDWKASGTGIAFGKVAEKDNTMQVALNAEFEGTMVRKGNRYCFSSVGETTVTGYVLIARIAITATNADSPLTFVLGRRKAMTPMTVSICFESSSEVTPALKTIVYEGTNYGAFLVQSGGSVWDLYVQKNGGYDEVTLMDWFTTAREMKQVEVTFPGTLSSSLPQPYYRATPAKLESLIDFIFPVNSVYISYSQVSPAELFGGTWTRIENRFLWGTTSGGTIGQTGGSQTHTLTVDEMPKHDHGSYYTNATTTNFSYAWLTPNGSAMGHGPVSAGGGKAHNNMPPYIQVSIWRRTA